MGEKGKKELEELYLGVPDESVNLTFQHFAQLRQQHNPDNIPLATLPSIDFKKAGLQEASFQTGPYNHHQHHQRSMVYDDMSHVSTLDYGNGNGATPRRSARPGIPHSNICTICCNYIYISRHRCLVCGRVYCRQCVSMGMGEMTQGRKCIDCLGRRFSQRYMHKAGNVGCCMGYSSAVKQQELKWAEKGARRSGMMMRSRSPVAGLHSPPTPTVTIINHHSMPFQ